MKRVVIIGGGISGLAAAHRLRVESPLRSLPLEIHLVEASLRLGGVLKTRTRDGFLLEGGPDCLLSTKTRALELCKELGLENQLINTRPEHRRSFIVRHGALHPIPLGFYLIGPSELKPFLSSPILSWKGKARVLLEALLPAKPQADESLASFVRRRLGPEVLDWLAQPLLAGIYAADPETLSLKATFPLFLEMEEKYGSILVGLKKRGQATRQASGARYSLFVTLRDGLQTLADHLEKSLAGVTVRQGISATQLQRTKNGWDVHLTHDEVIKADAVCLALPSHVCAELLSEAVPSFAEQLNTIPYSSAATINLAFKESAIRHPLDGIGFVVPHAERRTVLACTFAHRKFAGRVPPGHVLLRAFVGGALQEELLNLNDAELERRVLKDLHELLGISEPPLFCTIDRWPRAMPQYTLGHVQRVLQIEERLLGLPGLALAGNWQHGVGIPDCIESGERAADQLMDALAVEPALSEIMKHLGLALLAGAACYLFLANLGSGDLWQDEAQTALISRTVLQGGIPRGTDGKNYFSQELGAEYGPGYVWKWHTWLPFYVLAGSFAGLGQTTSVARLPFALFGLATVFLTYAFAGRLFKSRRLALLSAGALALSVPFLLLSRQCRYYPMAAFFFSWGLLSYRQVLDQKRHALYYWVIASTLLFHTHYIYGAVLWLTVLAHGYYFHRARWPEILRSVFWAALLNAPWALWLATTPYRKMYTPGFLNLPEAFMLAGGFVRQVFGVLWKPPLWIAALVLLLVTIRRRDKNPGQGSWVDERVMLLVLAIGMHIAVLGLTAPALFLRYLVSAIPVLCVLTGWQLDRLCAVDKRLGIAAALGVLLTQPLTSFLYELTHAYTGPVDGIVAFLKQNARPTDIVAITYDDLPLKFYTPLRVVGGLTGEDLKPIDHADWVIWRKHIICSKDADVARYIYLHLNKKNYRPITIPAPDVEFQNREEPGLHHFRTVTEESRVVIYQKMR